ncbi:hypothetical protein GCM10022221_67690 [Actinocorallia aurea]
MLTRSGVLMLDTSQLDTPSFTALRDQILSDPSLLDEEKAAVGLANELALVFFRGINPEVARILTIHLVALAMRNLFRESPPNGYLPMWVRDDGCIYVAPPTGGPSEPSAAFSGEFRARVMAEFGELLPMEDAAHAVDRIVVAAQEASSRVMDRLSDELTELREATRPASLRGKILDALADLATDDRESAVNVLRSVVASLE